MKLIYNVLIMLSVPVALILMSNAGGSPGGRTGSPGDGTNCTACHAGIATPQTAWISSDIPAQGYEAGETYTITATGTHSGVQKFGFELTAEDQASDKVGTFTITNSTRTKLANASQAVTHTSGGNTPTANSATWSMDWTAPDVGTGTVVFYAAFNAANGNEETSGDQIYTSLLTVEEYVAVPHLTDITPEFGRQGQSLDVVINAADTDWMSGVTSISFNLSDDPNVSFEPSSFTVNSNTQITASLDITSDQELGIYHLWVDNIELQNAFSVEIVDGVNDNVLASAISLYPNPSTERLFVGAPLGAEVSIINLIGQQVKSFTSQAPETTVDVSAFDAGIYIIRVHQYGEQASFRFIKN